MVVINPRTIGITDNKPLLDYLIEAADVFSNHNEIFVRFKDEKNGLTKAVDLFKALRVFSGGLNIFPEVYYDSCKIETDVDTDCKTNAFLIAETDQEFSKVTQPNEFLSYIVNKETGAQISVRMLENTHPKTTPSNHLADALSEQGLIEEPKPDYVLSFLYDSPSPFYVYTYYENPINLSERSGWSVFSVSEKKEHVVSNDLFNVISEPLKWHSTGKYLSLNTRWRTGRFTIEELAEDFKQEPNFLELKLELHKNSFYKGINCFVENEGNLLPLIEYMDCPVTYKGFTVRNFLGSLKHHVILPFKNGCTEPAENLTREYNRWANKNNYTKVSDAEELVACLNKKP